MPKALLYDRPYSELARAQRSKVIRRPALLLGPSPRPSLDDQPAIHLLFKNAMSSRSGGRACARNPQPSKRRPTPAPTRPAKRAASAKGAAPKAKPRPKKASVAAPAPALDLPKYEFRGRLRVILCGKSHQEERVAIEGAWCEKGSEQTCAFSRMFREDDDLASSDVAPPDGVWEGMMCVGNHASYNAKAQMMKDCLVLRFRASGPDTYALDGEGSNSVGTYKLTGEAKASDGGFDVTLERTYGLAPKLPPRRRSRAPPPAPKRASTRSSGETLADFDGNGGAKARLNGREYAAFWRKASGVDDLDVDAWVKREADAYREANNLGESERATRCAEHVYEKRRDLFEGQFANPVYVISDRLCHYLDARSERTATDVTAAATDEAPAPAPAAVTVASAPSAAAPSAGDAVAAMTDSFLGQAAAFALDGVVQDLSSDMSGVAAALLARSVPLSQLALGHLTLSCLDLCMLPVKVSVAGRTHLFHAAPLFSIGTHRANDVIVEDSAVASLHCVVLVLSRQIIVFGDFGEAGTRLVGDAVATARSPLVARRRDGARLRLGRDDAAPLVVISPLPGTA